MYEPNAKRRADSLAHGDLGCCLALLDLFRVSGNQIFLHLTQGIIDFQNQILLQKDRTAALRHNEVNPEFIFWYIRIQELRMMKIIHQQALGGAIENYFSDLNQEVDLILGSGAIKGRENDLAYLNLIFIQCNAILESMELSGVITKMTAHLIGNLEDVVDPYFLSGRLGIMYSLLKSIDLNAPQSSIIYFPVNALLVTVPSIRNDSVLCLSLAAFNNLLIQKDFPYTLFLLTELVPDKFDLFIKTYHHKLIDSLITFVAEEGYLRDNLKLPFEQELFVFELKSEPSYWDIPNTLHNISLNNEAVISSDEDFMKLRLTMAQGVTVLSYEIPCQYDQKITPDELIKIGSKSFLLRTNLFGKIESIALDQIKIILDALGETGSVSDAILRCKEFILGQHEETKKIFFERNWTNESECETMFIKKLRYLLAVCWIVVKV
ncbi:hypothetical protein J2X69_005123 [Algoriphagus sp. 4150]|nr:hypothetical protein [Algoriphagus sp. 4150]